MHCGWLPGTAWEYFFPKWNVLESSLRVLGGNSALWIKCIHIHVLPIKASSSRGKEGQEEKVSEWMNERDNARNSSENTACKPLIMRNPNSRWYNCNTELHPPCAEGRWTNRRCHRNIPKIYDSEFPTSLSSDLLCPHTHSHTHVCFTILLHYSVTDIA